MRRLACLIGLASVVLCAPGCGGRAAVEPGGEVDGMVLASARLERGVLDLFGFCRPVVVRSGTFERRCSVPWVARLYVGYGWFARPARLETQWRNLRWQAWLDGRRLDLPAFGTSERTLPAYAPAGYRDVTLRTFDVVVFAPKEGAHTLRYRVSRRGTPWGDVTWRFRVEPR